MSTIGDMEIKRIVCSCGGDAVKKENLSKTVWRSSDLKVAVPYNGPVRVEVFQCPACKTKLSFYLREEDNDM